MSNLHWYKEESWKNSVIQFVIAVTNHKYLKQQLGIKFPIVKKNEYMNNRYFYIFISLFCSWYSTIFHSPFLLIMIYLWFLIYRFKTNNFYNSINYIIPNIIAEFHFSDSSWSFSKSPNLLYIFVTLVSTSVWLGIYVTFHCCVSNIVSLISDNPTEINIFPYESSVFCM